MSAATPAVVKDPFAKFTGLERQIVAAEEDAVLCRWLFGRAVLEERNANGGKQLPNGRLAEVCEAVGRSRSEIQQRMRFAERFPTADEVDTAVHTFGSWTAIRGAMSKTAALQKNVAAMHPAWAAEQNSRDDIVEQQEEYDADVSQHGPNPSVHRPRSEEAELLRKALQKFAAGAREVRLLIEREPLVPLAVPVAELYPPYVGRVLNASRAALDAVTAVYRLQHQPTALPDCDGSVIEMNVDGDPDDTDARRRVAEAAELYRPTRIIDAETRRRGGSGQ
jgi:hypothetical protein